MKAVQHTTEVVDPEGKEALFLLPLAAIETDYKAMRLETSDGEKPAVAPYGSFRVERIAPFGD